ncbi:hypothetical protein SLITK23_59720 [Streptomyces lividans]|nr:hypothetical protein SLITK23_59720 [Streptomyces lividans]
MGGGQSGDAGSDDDYVSGFLFRWKLARRGLTCAHGPSVSDATDTAPGPDGPGPDPQVPRDPYAYGPCTRASARRPSGARPASARRPSGAPSAAPSGRESGP